MSKLSKDASTLDVMSLHYTAQAATIFGTRILCPTNRVYLRVIWTDLNPMKLSHGHHGCPTPKRAFF